jgi:hypothetical protein
LALAPGPPASTAPSSRRGSSVRVRRIVGLGILGLAIVSLEVWALSQIPDSAFAEPDRPVPVSQAQPPHEATPKRAQASVMIAFSVDQSEQHGSRLPPSPRLRRTAVALAKAGHAEGSASSQDHRRPAMPKAKAEPPVAPIEAAPVVFRGALIIESSPEGARVLVDRQVVGATPLVVPDLLVGTRLVRVEADGHEPWSAAVRVVADEQTGVSVRLVPRSNR